MTDFEELPEAVNTAGQRATFADEKYGPHERNNFDVWLAKSDKPTPLVVYIHGGGFVGGDKSKYFAANDMLRFLENGISVAVINYRFLNSPPYGILGSMRDSKRFVQHIRFHSQKYNIDKTQIGCIGGSAGAGTALWLAFSADMADAGNADPVLRESTKLTCAGAFATQATYDIFLWDKILGIPITQLPEQQQAVARAFGFKSADGIDLKNEVTIRRELDFLSKMDQNDPPIFVYNKHRAGIPENSDDVNHHPLHAKALKEKAEQVGLEAVVYAPEIGIIDPSGKDVVSFFIEKFNL